MRFAVARLVLCVFGIVPGLLFAAFVSLMGALGPRQARQEWLLPLSASMVGLFIAAVRERGSVKITLACFLAVTVSVLGLWWINFRY